MDRSEGNDDELYPSAPVPPHERGWRHPSEMGAQAWATSEPPLTIGRGLTATTGFIGGALALAVLWTMMPTHAGRRAVVSVRSTLANVTATTTVSSSSALVVTLPSTTVPSSPSSTGAVPSTAPSSAPASTAPEAPTSTPQPTGPLPTYALASGATTPQVAVAVAVGNGGLVITTAAAVRKDNTVELRLPDGGIETASVLLVDQRAGFAVLAHDAVADMAAFTVASSVEPGDELSFYGAGDMTVVVQDDGSIQTASTDPSAPMRDLPEGTPVVNQRGELVALCSHLDGEPTLVSLEHLDPLRRALSEPALDNHVWMGVVLDTSEGSLAITALAPDGPAMTAGVQQGDLITAIDGVDVMDISAIGAALQPHEPGDVVHVAVRRGEVEMAFDVTLATAHSAL